MTELSSIRILIVDDDRIVADTLALLVTARGYTARAVYSGEEAAALIEKFRPHAVISDVMLPGLDGLELADWLEDKDPHCKVLLISGKTVGEAPTSRFAQQRRARTILLKPVYPTDLFRFLATVTPADPPSTPDLSRLRVLIVDNERLIADSLAMIAETKGCIVRTAYDGAQAASIADEFNPHACITDLVMPAMDGVELASWLGEHQPGCKVLLISAYLGSDEAIDRLIPHDLERTALPKPIHPTEIFKFLATCSPVGK